MGGALFAAMKARAIALPWLLVNRGLKGRRSCAADAIPSVQAPRLRPRCRRKGSEIATARMVAAV
jgi:hypothetical protein